MKPVFIPHDSYQRFVLEQLRKHYSGGILVLVNADWPVILKCYIRDLYYSASFLHDLYDDRGPTPCDPASMLRSYLLFLMSKTEIGITK
ncbi:hypothetical protein [Brevibacillus sp. NRS-1366]|uniref:hypothetical protein n=1 Tax=Brevibacillus sp. NRS-1366 TaxID=3233899 RepID=UPI003D1B251F